VHQYDDRALTRLIVASSWGNMLAAAVMVTLSPVVVPALFGQDFSASVPLVMLLGVAQVFAGPSHVLEGALLSRGRPHIPAKAQYAALTVTAAGLIAFVPLWGVAGAAVATILAFLTSYAFVNVGLARDLRVRSRDLMIPGLGRVATEDVST
jgi:O-antigen/teichoic acid export membrane protein